MIGYNGSVGLRNDGLDALTSKIDLNAAVGVLVTVRIATVPSGTGALASLFDINDVAIANPITTDNFGNYFFKIDEGTYDIITREGTPDVVTEPSQLMGASSPFKRVIPFDTLDLARTDVNPLNIFNGAVLNLEERTTGNGGGAMWDVYPSGAFPTGPLIFDVIAHATLPLQLKLRKESNRWYPAQFGLISDDATGTIPVDNFKVLNYISSIMVDYMSLEFDGGVVNLAHDFGYQLSAINGYPALKLQSLKSIWLNGNGACIKVTNHDLAVNNGLLFLGFDAVQTLHVNGFTSEMSFVNRNNSATYYPFCGFAEGIDTLGTPTARAFDELSSDLHFYSITFNNFHPEGSFGQALNSFPGDPNNGFKIYGVTVLGDTNAAGREFQNTGVTFRDNSFLPTHNGYGFWSWAYNNVEAHGNKATQFNGWSSDSNGVESGAGVPMIRYHQWFCSGYDVHDNQFTARDIADRVGAYKGPAYFCHATQNSSAEWQRGETNVHDNEISLRTSDIGIAVNTYGTVNIHNNNINGVIASDRPLAGIDILTFENGKGWYSIKGNNVDENFSGPLVRVEVGATLAANRRVKSLTIDNNDVKGSFGNVVAFVDNTGKTTLGVERFYCRGNTFDGENSEFSPANTNGAVIFANTVTEATDVFTIKNNEVRHFYNIELSGPQTVVSEGNGGDNITASTNYNYLPTNKQTVLLKEVTTGNTPRVGVDTADLFRYTAERRSTTSGLVLQVSSGSVPGGSSFAGATPANEVWYIEQTGIANKGIAIANNN